MTPRFNSLQGCKKFPAGLRRELARATDLAPFFAPFDASLSPESTKFPAFSQPAGNLGSETSSLETASSRGEMLWGGRRGWQFRRLHQSMECRDAPAERFEQVPRAPGPR